MDNPKAQCPNKCGTEVEMGELEKHKKDHCELREYECPYCEKAPEDATYLAPPNYKGTYRDVTTKHFKECDGYPVACPNDCGAQGLVRGSLRPSHLAGCPKQVVPCTYQSLGCSDRVARKEMRSHLENKDKHLVLAMGTTLDLVHQLSRVEAEHRTLISDLANQLSEHKSSTDSQQQQITTLQQQVSVLLKKSGVQLPSAPQHPAKPWLKVDPLPLYPPFTIKMDFRTKDEVVSPSFMTHPGGYRLVLKTVRWKFWLEPVDCPEHHSLKWPVMVVMKFVILNQKEDKDHMKKELKLLLDHPNTKSLDGNIRDRLKNDNSIHYMTVADIVTREMST